MPEEPSEPVEVRTTEQLLQTGPPVLVDTQLVTVRQQENKKL